MLIPHVILATLAVALIALRPRSAAAAATLLAMAACDLALGGRTGPVLGVALPLMLFLTAALSLAGLVERSGLAERAAVALATIARGNTRGLYACTCLLCAGLTAAVSLDGAVVLMVPVLVLLCKRFKAPIRPLFLGVVAVANAASIALPQGNPTNLVVIQRLDLSPAAFAVHMLLPGLVAAALCAMAVARLERGSLSGRYDRPSGPTTRLSGPERHAAAALCGAAAAAWAAPLFGIAPWWPFTGAVAVGLIGRRPQLAIPWRIAAQLLALLVVIASLGFAAPTLPLGLPGLLAVAGGIAAIAAIANNLPASVWAGALLAGQTGYAASIGLAVGSLATPHGSVATLIAADLAGHRAPPFPTAKFTLIAAGAVLVATLLLWAGL
jgi:arsenical pump membrane protein